MAQSRSLPKKRNPLLGADKCPDPPRDFVDPELVSRRRLGQTQLTVPANQVGNTNATAPENLGTFDYAHLRAPLPTNLKGSEVFTAHYKQPYPESYFLMRRSKDGYVSATGMFRASFPWAKASEEMDERTYLKSLPESSHEEVAGNVWIPEDHALRLAADYGIAAWIEALIDSAPIMISPDEKKVISPPPPFQFKANDGTSAATPTPRHRGRPRASSPTKTPAASKIASPRKRVTKKEKEANATASRQASEMLQATLDSAAAKATSVEPSEDQETEDDEAKSASPAVSKGKAKSPHVNGDTSPPAKKAATHETPSKERKNHSDNKVMVEVDSAVEINGDMETTHTTVKVEMPAGSPDLPLPEDTQAMIETAKEMVEEARKLEGESSSSGAKRKAEELDDSDSAGDEELQPAKKARLLEQELKKQRVRTRAMFGIAATLAIGAIIPYVV
ncbi:hypothetical protein MMC25_005930 [Agyrium rufum]|nr:hypothetical protein [Agyrium rufum]